MSPRKLTALILARDAAGVELILNEYTTVFDTRTMDNPATTSTGLWSYTLDGAEVDQVSEAKFKMRKSGIILQFVARQPVGT